MVTHDVGLKYFADRIIWLRDGKIQRVEHVSEVKRAETMNSLHNELEQLGIQSDKHSGDNSNSEKKENKIHNFSNTQVRRPTDYRTHKNHDASEFIFIIILKKSLYRLLIITT